MKPRTSFIIGALCFISAIIIVEATRDLIPKGTTEGEYALAMIDAGTFLPVLLLLVSFLLFLIKGLLDDISTWNNNL